MICFIISSLRTGGAERVLCDLANRTPKCAIITLMPSDESPSYPLQSHVQLFRLGDHLTTPFSKSSPWQIIKALYRIRKTIKYLKPKLVVSFLDRINVLTLLLTRGLTVPVVVSERIDPHFHDIGKVWTHLRKLTYPWAKTIVCQTQSAADYFSFPVTIIPNAVAVPSHVKTHYKSIQNIITVGRLVPQKDHITLIRALEDFPDLKLTIYGEGELYHDLQYITSKRSSSLYPDRGLTDQEYGIDKIKSQDFLQDPYLPSLPVKRRHVFLKGIIQDIDQTLSQADLFIFPSLYEGFPNALCEAMRVGLPVIASDCSGNRDIIQDGVNGLLFPVGDRKALKNCLQRLMSNPKLAQELGENAKEIINDYPSEKIFSRWENLFQSSM